MRRSSVGIAIASVLLLSGAVLPGTPIEVRPASAHRNMPILPDCPGRIGEVHYIAGAEHVREDFVDLSCTYHEPRNRKTDRIAGIRAWYYTPPAGPGVIPGREWCGKTRGEEAPERVGPQQRSGKILSDDHYIWVSYQALHFPARKAREAARQLMDDLIVEGRVVACLDEERAGAGTGASGPALDDAVDGFIAAYDAWLEREPQIDALDEQSVLQAESGDDQVDRGQDELAAASYADSLSLGSRAAAAEAYSSQLYAADLADLALPSEEQALIDELIARNHELIELLQEMIELYEALAAASSSSFGELEAMLDQRQERIDELDGAIDEAREAERIAFLEAGRALGVEFDGEGE